MTLVKADDSGYQLQMSYNQLKSSYCHVSYVVSWGRSTPSPGIAQRRDSLPGGVDLPWSPGPARARRCGKRSGGVSERPPRTERPGPAGRSRGQMSRLGVRTPRGRDAHSFPGLWDPVAPTTREQPLLGLQSATAHTKANGSAKTTGWRPGLTALEHPHLPAATFCPATSSLQSGQEFPAFFLDSAAPG